MSSIVRYLVLLGICGDPLSAFAQGRVLVLAGAVELDALAPSLRARGWEIRRAALPFGSNGLHRLAEAQRLMTDESAALMIWLEAGTGGATRLLSLGAGSDAARQIGLDGPLESMSPAAKDALAARLDPGLDVPRALSAPSPDPAAAAAIAQPAAADDASVEALPAVSAPPPEAPKDTRRLFVELGLALGVGWVTSGRLADRAPQDPSSPAAASFIPAGDPTCPQDPGQYCVRVVAPGAVILPAVRLSLGVELHRRIALAAVVRFQPDSGLGTLSSLLVGFRAQLRLGSGRGLIGGLHTGSSVGQIQARPSQAGAEEPYVISGLMSMQLGGSIGYRFKRGVSIVFAPEAHFLYPVFAFVVDLTTSMSVAF